LADQPSVVVLLFHPYILVFIVIKLFLSNAGYFFI